MKILVIVTHPYMDKSVINKRWIEVLSKYPETFHIHELHKVYPDEKIDVEAEQKLISKFDKIVFQFPIFWFNCPPFLKKYLDEVFTHGWAYGSESVYRVGGKQVALAVSAGINENDYKREGRYGYTLEEILRPFEVTFKYVHADYRPFFAFYDIEQDSSDKWIESSIAPYLKFLNAL